MIKIKKIDINKANNIISEDNPSFSGILTGESVGDIWVDNIETPSLALVHSFAVGGYSIMGNPQEDIILKKLYDFLITELFPQLKEENEEFEFSVESDEIKKRFFDMFTGQKIESEDEYYFRNQERIVKNRKIPDGYTIANINSEFIHKLENGKIENKEMLETRLLESWGSYQNFLQKSVAFVAIYQKRIDAVILGTARFHNIIPIDIETNEKHRNKGLASVLTEYFVNECIEKKLVAQWNCVDSNHASKKTAKNAGFKLLKKDQYHWFET